MLVEMHTCLFTGYYTFFFFEHTGYYTYPILLLILLADILVYYKLLSYAPPTSYYNDCHNLIKNNQYVE